MYIHECFVIKNHLTFSKIDSISAFYHDSNKKNPFEAYEWSSSNRNIPSA